LTPNGLAEQIHRILEKIKTESRVLFWKVVGLGNASPCVSITVVADDAIIVSRSFSACVEKSTGSIESADEIVKAQFQTVLSDIQSGSWSTDWISAGKCQVMSVNLSNMMDGLDRAAFGVEEIGQVTYSFEPKDNDYNTLVVPQTLTLEVHGGDASYDPSGEELYQEVGIRVVFKGVVKDSFEYSDDIHLLLLVENSSLERLTFDINYDSVSLNGYMTDFLCYGRTVAPGGSGVVDVALDGSSLEENGITEPEDIEEAELTVEARNDDYETVAKPVVTVKVK